MDILEYQKDLEKRALKPVNLIYGEEEYLYRNFLDRLRSLYRVEVLWGDELSKEDLLNRLSEDSLFSLPLQKRVLVIREADDFFKKVKDGKYIQTLVKRLKNSYVFFVVFEKLSVQDLEKEPYKSISAVGDVIELKRVDKRRVRELIKSKLEKEGITIDEQALDFLVSAADHDLLKLKNETDKILLLGKKHVTLKDIVKISPWEAQANVFDFLDALFTRSKENAIVSLSSLLRSETQPLQVFAVISNYAIKLYVAHRLIKEGEPVESALQKVDIKHPFQINKFKYYLSRTSELSLKIFISRLNLTDMRMKVFFENPEKALRNLVLEYLGL